MNAATATPPATAAATAATEQPRLHAPLKSIREVKPNSFLFEKPGALTAAICDGIIRRFEKTPAEQFPGRVGEGKHNFDLKRSTDIYISDKPHWKSVNQQLNDSLTQALDEFSESFPFFKQRRLKHIGYGIQRTRKGEFFHWHIDSITATDRQLVAIWYLNDIKEGGETEFFVQNARVRPQRGKLLLFPPFWTHEHRGVRPLNEVKYIATTWVLFE